MELEGYLDTSEYFLQEVLDRAGVAEVQGELALLYETDSGVSFGRRVHMIVEGRRSLIYSFIGKAYGMTRA